MIISPLICFLARVQSETHTYSGHRRNEQAAPIRHFSGLIAAPPLRFEKRFSNLVLSTAETPAFAESAPRITAENSCQRGSLSVLVKYKIESTQLWLHLHHK